MKATPYTTYEARELFIKAMWEALEYWDKLPNKSKREALEGLMHTFLATGIDGCGATIPAMELKPIVSDEDVQYHRKNGQRWFPSEDIGGGLHEIMYVIGREYNFVKD